MRRSPFSPIVPFHGFTKPEWPYRINRDSQQAEDLRFWFSGMPPGGGIPGTTQQLAWLDHVTGTRGANTGSVGWASALGGIATGALNGAGGGIVWQDTGQLLHPTDGVTILTHVIRASATDDLTIITGSGTSVINVLVPYSDGVVYFDFGGTSSPNRISIAGLTFHNDDIIVMSAGLRGSEIWFNGALVASQPTPIVRVAGIVDINMSFVTGVSSIAEYRVNGVQFSQALCQQMSEPQGRWDLYAPIRQRGWMLPSVAGSVVSAKVPYQPNYQWAPILAQ